MITLFGIPNCDTIKKAKKWLEQHHLEYQFHDYRKQGIDMAMLEQFEQALGWELMLNKRGTTYRALSDEQKNTLNRDNALALLLEHPAMIKRPILVTNEQHHIGFKADQYAEIFAQ